MDLLLDTDDVFPRRLTVFPCGNILAYGDDYSSLSCIEVLPKGKTSIRKFPADYDAAIRAVAVSTDGQRVALGFDNGETRVYQYNDYNPKNTKFHPFIPPPKTRSNDDDSDAESDEDDGSNQQHDKSWMGPSLRAAVRDLKFFPNSHWLAIASEDSDQGVCVVNVASEDTTSKCLLGPQCKDIHNSSGVRGASVTTTGNNHFMASLAMDGRLCVWQASPSSLEKLDGEKSKVPATKEDKQCVTKVDAGEASGFSDVYDRSSLPLWVSSNVLVLPGQTHLQLRHASLKDGKVVIQESKQPANSDPSKGHIETIVALTSAGDLIVSSGRDGRVILWRLEEDEDGLPIAHFLEKLGQYQSAPTFMYWNEASNNLYIACSNGTLELVPEMHKKKRFATKKSTRSCQGTKEVSLDVSKEGSTEVDEVSAPTKISAKDSKPNKTLGNPDGEFGPSSNESTKTGQSKTEQKTGEERCDKLEELKPAKTDKSKEVKEPSGTELDVASKAILDKPQDSPSKSTKPDIPKGKITTRENDPSEESDDDGFSQLISKFSVSKKSTDDADLEDSDDETMNKPKPKILKQNSPKRKTAKSTLWDSEDDGDSDKEDRESKTPTDAKTKAQIDDNEMIDTQEDFVDGPENQPPPATSVLEQLDDDDGGGAGDKPSQSSKSPTPKVTDTPKPMDEDSGDEDFNESNSTKRGKAKATKKSEVSKHDKETDNVFKSVDTEKQHAMDEDSEDEDLTESKATNKSNVSKSNSANVKSASRDKGKHQDEAMDEDSEDEDLKETKATKKSKASKRDKESDDAKSVDTEKHQHAMDEDSDEDSDEDLKESKAANKSKATKSEAANAKRAISDKSKHQDQAMDEDSDDEDLKETKATKKSGGNKSANLDETDDDVKSVGSDKANRQQEAAEETKILEIDTDDEDSSVVEVSAQPSTNSTKRLTKKAKPAAQADEHGDDDDDDDIFEEDIANHGNQAAVKATFIDDEAEDAKDDDDDEIIAVGMSQEDARDNMAANNATQTSADLEGDDNAVGFTVNDDNYDDDDNSMADDIAKINESYQQSRQLAGLSAGPALPDPQAAFAPSATPLDLSRRFLCWNHIGSITLMQGDDVGRSTVDIDFTNSAFGRRPITFTDNMGFILGSLGDDGAIFASDLAHDDQDDLDDLDDDVTGGLSLSAQTKAALKKSQRQRMKKGSKPLGSSIYFHRFETIGHPKDKDWYLTLPDGERVLGCACGTGWAAVATSRKFLRFFLSGGSQGHVLWLPGNPVTMVGRNRFLAVFYHESIPLPDGTQKLGYLLYDAVAHRTISKGSVSCTSSGSSLSWAGFSNDYSLMAMDSDGMLSMLVATEGETDGPTPTSWEWAPLLDTVGLRKSSEDNFWPITCHDGKLLCIPLRGGIQYPDVTGSRRPTPATLKLRMPLAKSTFSKSSASLLEELSVRANMALVQKKVNNEIIGVDDDFEEEYRSAVAGVDKVTLKLFAAAIEAGKQDRAFDMVHRLNLEMSYGLAEQIAEGRGYDKLADAIQEEKEKRFGQDGSVAGSDDGQDDDEISEGEGHAHDHQSPPVGSSTSRNISPESNRLSSKRPMTQHSNGGRSVRARAF
ncbi:WD repeat and HMG-box DNA binding protein 1 [Seminavis robusta]|uniref:WD repeat and HMG-box DNA binding protein 1 n=1 Tax=Seminavis robusta TaxID=568900 RepID=A0A9N8DDI3_9STRA|nr:WD repeat and HMG-box DNA binding protein 1 [Seminavis robusta]|eukprot:Sro88_g046690.1 WD repeat and HMG-box DNA binding protein 1 (1592) ;mRNA; f:100957-106068